MDFRRKAIDLYKKGKTGKEISKIIGFEIEEKTLSNWIMEDDLKKRKSEMAYLEKQARKPGIDYIKKQEYRQKLKKLLEDTLIMTPDDIEMKVTLMYTCIGLGQMEEAEKMGYLLNEEINSSNVQILKGLSIIEEKKRDYDMTNQYHNKCCSYRWRNC